MREYNRGANPYMPLWEHVPDGEPRVFEYMGEKRVYVYGSHDTLRDNYCGDDQVVWSAPINDLTDWRCDGVCYKATDHSILYAPDVVQKGDTFYLYAAEQCGGKVMVAKSKNPAGPFTDPVLTELGFDPGILVDEDGRVYAYWGFCKCYSCELNEDMATIKPGTLIGNPIGHCNNIYKEEDPEHIDYKFGFFEASSPRKIGNKYIYIYSKRYDEPVPALGVYEQCNGFLSYAYSDTPLGKWTFGGDIILNGGEIIKNEDGTGTMTYRWGNNHGSIAEVNGQWYVFYHRHTSTNEYARQAMLDPVEVAIGEDGAFYIGKIHYNQDGKPIGQEPVEMTSQGAYLNGLDVCRWTQAASTCFLYGGKKNAYIQAVYDKIEDVSAPVMDITDGLSIGYRYMQFGEGNVKSAVLKLKVHKHLIVSIHIDQYNGPMLGEQAVDAGVEEIIIPITTQVFGKHAVYFTFHSEANDSIAEFARFIFE